MSNCLVTGSAGFIGWHIGKALLSKGHRVIGVDIKHGTDILELCRDAMAGIDCVFHQAAIPSALKSFKDPGLSTRVNIDGTLNVLMAAKDANVKRVVFAGSSSVYGDAASLPITEGGDKSPQSIYAATKLMGEIYCRLFYDLYGLETVTLRYFNVFGPRQEEAGVYAAVIPRFIVAKMRGGKVTICGDGEQSRDFTYIDNVVQANLLAMTTPGIGGQSFNIGCGQGTTLNELAKMIGVDVEYDAERPGDVRHSLADISQARDVLGYNPLVGVEGGLSRMVPQILEANR